jgi:hypothetical protein
MLLRHNLKQSETVIEEQVLNTEVIFSHTRGFGFEVTKTGAFEWLWNAV